MASTPTFSEVDLYTISSLEFTVNVAASASFPNSIPFSINSALSLSLSLRASFIFSKNLSLSKLALVIVINRPSIINLSKATTSIPISSALTPNCDIPFKEYIIKSCKLANSAVLPHIPTLVQPLPPAVS